MQTQSGQKNGEGSRRRSVETKAVGALGGEEHDQFETEAGVGFVNQSSNARFARRRVARDLERRCASISMISFLRGHGSEGTASK